MTASNHRTEVLATARQNPARRNPAGLNREGLNTITAASWVGLDNDVGDNPRRGTADQLPPPDRQC